MSEYEIPSNHNNKNDLDYIKTFEKLGEEVPFDPVAAKEARTKAYKEMHPDAVEDIETAQAMAEKEARTKAYKEMHPDAVEDIDEAQLRAKAEDYHQTQASKHLKEAEEYGARWAEGPLKSASISLKLADEASERAAERYHDENSVRNRIAKMRETREPEHQGRATKRRQETEEDLGRQAAKSEKMQAYLEEHPEETKNHIVDINEAQLRAEAEDYHQTQASEHLKKAEKYIQEGHSVKNVEEQLKYASDALKRADEASERAAERYHDENSVRNRIAKMRETREPEHQGRATKRRQETEEDLERQAEARAYKWRQEERERSRASLREHLDEQAREDALREYQEAQKRARENRGSDLYGDGIGWKPVP